MLVAAVEAFLDGQPDADRASAHDRHAHRGGPAGALAVGVVVGIGARALYRRARGFDLERVARAVEQRLVN